MYPCWLVDRVQSPGLDLVLPTSVQCTHMQLTGPLTQRDTYIHSYRKMTTHTDTHAFASMHRHTVTHTYTFTHMPFVHTYSGPMH